MDKTITTAILIIISMIMALMLFNIAYPAVIAGGDAINSMANRANERLQSQIVIVHASAELDKDGWWQDTNSNGEFEVFVWTKNIGTSRIIGIDQLDVFFGIEGDFKRIPHQKDAGGSYPYWDWQIENATDWTPTATLAIMIHYQYSLASGQYYVKVTTPNGIDDEYFLGM